MVMREVITLWGKYRMVILHANKTTKIVLSDSRGQVDFAIGLVNSVFNLPDGQVIFF